MNDLLDRTVINLSVLNTAIEISEEIGDNIRYGMELYLIVNDIK